MIVRSLSTFAAVIVLAAALTPLRALAQTPAASGKAAGGDPVVVMKTSMGEIRIKLNKEKAPVSVENFLSYVNKKFYDGTIFHRVIPGFMIQGGGFTPDLNRKATGAPIKLESMNGLKNTRGTIAMARTADPNSATSQFFINVVDNSSKLDGKSDTTGYAVFGEVISGMDVAEKIVAVPTTTKNGMGDVPVTPVIIESVRLATGS